ncbi:MAG: hypothetical protein L0154_04145 [Chloroflexi bacterium]|nr:hypothetical protein [Chloroflexota bacterium]
MPRILVILFVVMLLLPVPVTAQETFTINGQVVQGTIDGAPLPQNLPLQLVIIGPDNVVVQEFNTTAGPDYSFSFAGVPVMGDDHTYAVTTTYAGLPQVSLPVPASEASFIEFPLYETTTTINPAQMRILAGDMIIAFQNVEQIGVAVIFEMTILNVGNRILYGEEPSFTFELPVGAYNVAPLIEEGVQTRTQMLRFEAATIPLVHDQAPILPNVPHTISVSYFMPYELGAIIHQVFPVAVTNLTIWVPDGTVFVESDYHQKSEDTITDRGVTYVAYDQTESIEVDENNAANVIFSLGGVPPQSQRTSVNERSDDDNGGISPLIFALAGGLLLLLGVVWFVARRRVDEAA